MEFQNKVVVLTGSYMGIGKTIKEEFIKQEAIVCDIDIQDGGYYTGDIGKQEVLENFVNKVITDYGRVDIIVNNAPPLFKGIDECSYEEFMYALQVGVTAPFYLTKLCMP